MADALELSDDDDDFEQRPDARGTFRKPAPMVDRAMPDCAISGRQMQMPAAAPPSQRELPPSQPLMLSDLEAPEPEPPLQITQYSTHPSQPSQRLCELAAPRARPVNRYPLRTSPAAKLPTVVRPMGARPSPRPVWT